MTNTKKLTLEEAVSELRIPENRASDEAFGRAWYNAYTNLDSSLDECVALHAQVPLYAIEKSELTPEAKKYLEARVAIKTEIGKRTFNAQDYDSVRSICEESRLKETELFLGYLTSLPKFKERAIKCADRFIESLKKPSKHSYEKRLEMYADSCFRVFDEPENKEINPSLHGEVFRGVKNTVIECAKRDGEQRLHGVSHAYSNGVGPLIPGNNPLISDIATPEIIRQKMIQYFSGIIEERKSQGGDKK
jgi:hypothetical protein